MKTIDADIRTGQLAPVYLLYGEEDYLKRQYRDKLKKALIKETDTMNFSSFQGKEFSLDEVIGLADTMPFFTEKRMILMEDSGLFKAGGQDLAAYLDEMPDTTCIVFLEHEVNRASKLYKTVSKAGRAVEFKRQNERTLTTWILARVKREKKNITQDALNQFLAMVGDEMDYIDHELEKILCYCINKDSIEASDIAAVCVQPLSNQVFQMIDRIAAKKQKEALELYYELLALKEPPARILYLIARQMQSLLVLKEMDGKGYDTKRLAEKSGVPEFRVRQNLALARGFTREQLYDAVAECVELEEAVKSGNLMDRIAVEMIIIKESA